MFNVIGNLQDAQINYAGQNEDFVIADIELDVSGKPVGVTAKGALGEKAEMLLADAPEGSLVQLIGHIEFRAYQERYFESLIVDDIILLGNTGKPQSTFKVQGIVRGTTEVGKTNPFEVGVFEVLSYGRDGHQPGTTLQLSLTDEQKAEWKAAEGKWAIVTGRITGWKSEKNGKTRIYPRFGVDQFTAGAVPSWISPIVNPTTEGEAQGEAEPEAELSF